MLILTSYTFNDTEMRLKMNELLPDQDTGKMLIIGLALDNMDPTERLNREVNGVTLLDFQKENVFVFDEKSPETYLQQDYQYIDMIGGNTFKLQYLTRKYGLDKFIKDQVAKGAVYIGGSAGAYLACPDIAHVASLDHNEYVTDGNFTGLGLMQDYVLCHYLEDDRHQEDRLLEFQQVLGQDAVVHTIKMRQMLVVDGNMIELRS